MEATSWPVVRLAFITIMHGIEGGEITWTDRQSLMQRHLMHTHAAALAPQEMGNQVSKNPALTESCLMCKFYKAGNRREF